MKKFRPNSDQERGRLVPGILALCLLASAHLLLLAAPAADVPRVTTQPPLPERLYRKAQTQWAKDSTNATAGWQLARACYDWAEYATNDTQRAAIAHEGIQACQRAIELSPTNAAAHFYLGLNYGQLAQTKLLGALKLVEQMEETWNKTITIDPKYDYAGPHRALGILYRDAPGWPTSIGSKSKARQHLLKAVELCPEYPGNRLSLLESYAKWGEYRLVQQQAEATARFLEEARTRFAGEAWALDWQEWDRVWERTKAKASIVSARSPNHP